MKKLLALLLVLLLTSLARAQNAAVTNAATVVTNAATDVSNAATDVSNAATVVETVVDTSLTTTTQAATGPSGSVPFQVKRLPQSVFNIEL